MVEGLGGIKKTVSLYVSTFGVLVLGLVASWFNREFDLPQEDMKIFGLIVHLEYVSAIVGILMSVFAGVVAVQIRLFRQSLESYADRDPGECRRIAMDVLYFPWVASPFHESKVSLVLFWVAMGSGCLLLLWITFVHITGAIETASPAAFRAIGFFSLFILVFVLVVLLRWVRKDVRDVRRMIAVMKVSGG